jgi:hypothetical protein
MLLDRLLVLLRHTLVLSAVLGLAMLAVPGPAMRVDHLGQVGATLLAVLEALVELLEGIPAVPLETSLPRPPPTVRPTPTEWHRIAMV